MLACLFNVSRDGEDIALCELSGNGDRCFCCHDRGGGAAFVGIVAPVAGVVGGGYDVLFYPDPELHGVTARAGNPCVSVCAAKRAEKFRDGNGVYGDKI